MERLILDTLSLLAAVRGQVDPRPRRHRCITIPIIAVAEYLAGTILDAGPGRAAQQTFLSEVLVVPTQDYDSGVAAISGAAGTRTSCRHQTKDSGPDRHSQRLASERTILTANTNARFEDLPGCRPSHGRLSPLALALAVGSLEKAWREPGDLDSGDTESRLRVSA